MELRDDISWRDHGVRTRLAKALGFDDDEHGAGLYKDVTFLVGPRPEVIRAHKLILRLSSTYLEKLIMQTELDQDADVIRLPEICPIMFKRLLKFIYTDEIEHENFEDFLNFATSFGFKQLQKICIESARKLRERGLSLENIIFVLKMVNYDEKAFDVGFKDELFEFIKINASAVLQSQSFLEISQPDLGNVFSFDDLAIKEDEGGEYLIYTVALRWAKHNCRKRNLEATPENLQEILAGVRFTIRYTQIAYEKLLSDVKVHGILSSNEFIQVLKTFIDPSDNPLGLCTRARSGIIRPEIVLPLNIQEIYNATTQEDADSLTRAPLKKIVRPNCEMLVLPNEKKKLKTTHHHSSEFTHDVQLDNLEEYYLQEMDPNSLPQPATQTTIRMPMPVTSPLGNNISYPIITDMSVDPLEFILCDCTVEFSYLLSLIEPKQNNLRKVVLKNLHILRRPEVQHARAFLPYLESFVYDKDWDHNPETTIIPEDLSSVGGVKGLLFFEKNLNARWLFSRLPTLGVEIMLKYNGVHLMEIIPSKNKILLSFPEPSEGDFILENCPEDTKTLCCCGTGIKTPERIPTKCLENLVFYGVDINGMGSMRFLNKFPRLRNVSVYEMPKSDGQFNISQIHLASDFPKSRASLETLALSKFRIFGITPKSFKKSTMKSFPALVELFLHSCSWNDHFLQYFCLAFPNLKILGFNWSSLAPSSKFLKEVILNLGQLEFVSVSRFFIEGEMSLVDDNAEDKLWLCSFLEGLGLLVGNNVIPDFVLRRDLQSGEWIASGGSQEEFKLIYFNSLKLPEFFQHKEMLNFVNL